MKLNEINIRDPFILPYGGKYYMYGSRGFEAIGFDVYISEDLDENYGAYDLIYKYRPEKKEFSIIDYRA